MKVASKLWRIILALPFILLLNACTTDGVRTSGSVHSVYGGYYYPSYGYYGPCCIDYDDYERPDRPDRPEHPNRPVQPLPGDPSIQPIDRRPGSRPSTGMGRPSRPQMGMPARMPRGGGRRR